MKGIEVKEPKEERTRTQEGSHKEVRRGRKMIDRKKCKKRSRGKEVEWSIGGKVRERSRKNRGRRIGGKKERSQKNEMYI